MIMLQSFGVVNKTVAAYSYNMLHPLQHRAHAPSRAAGFLAQTLTTSKKKKRPTLCVRLDSRLI